MSTTLNLPDRYDKAVGRLAPGKLVDAGIYFLRFAAEIDGLSDECPVIRT